MKQTLFPECCLCHGDEERVGKLFQKDDVCLCESCVDIVKSTFRKDWEISLAEGMKEIKASKPVEKSPHAEYVEWEREWGEWREWREWKDRRRRSNLEVGAAIHQALEENYAIKSNDSSKKKLDNQQPPRLPDLWVSTSRQFATAVKRRRILDLGWEPM